MTSQRPANTTRKYASQKDGVRPRTTRRAGLRLSTVLTLVGLATPGAVLAQGIGGTVSDTTAAVLPGVTVEARSPALIEGLRTAVTDGNGRYLIVGLETGEYSLTYTLSGFGTVVREGIQLTTGFTANVDVTLEVGDIQETVVVSGAAPVLDVQNVEQRTVMSREVIEDIPTGRSLAGYGLLVPGMQGDSGYGTNLSQDSGGLTLQTMQRLAIHGGSVNDQVIQVNGLDVGDSLVQGGALVYLPDTNYEEISYSYSANSAEMETGGVAIDMIPREGGNLFSGTLFANFTSTGLHADNLDADLRERGLQSGTLVQENWGLSPAFGGPMVRDRLWFFLTHNRQRAVLQAPGVFQAVDPGALLFEPDTDRPSADESLATEQSINLTWQASSKDKFKAYWSNTATDKPFVLQGASPALRIFVTPEASVAAAIRTNTYQLSWARPHTNRLLIEAGASRQPIAYVLGPSRYAASGVPGVLDFSSLVVSRNASPLLGGTSRSSPKFTSGYRASVSYVTGSHNLKVGFNLLEQRTAVSHDSTANWLSINTFRGVPLQVNYWGNYLSEDHAPSLGIYAQEQWTADRLTVNAGLRFDYVQAGYPDQVRPTTPWVTQPFVIPSDVVVTWRDLQPRLGLAYDLRGDGRTAIKFAVNRYGARDATDWSQRMNPSASNRQQVRAWNDGLTGCIGDSIVCIPGDGLPQGDPHNPLPNGELLSPNNTPSFGVPAATRSTDPAWSSGWGNRQANWEIGTSIQHEITNGMSMSLGWFRRHQVNLATLDNRAVAAEDFDIGTVQVPLDSRLPGGGGQTLSFYDLKPTSVRPLDEVYTSVEGFGGESEVWRGLDFTMAARADNLLLQGGLSTGRVSHDYCDLQTRLPETLSARRELDPAPVPNRTLGLNDAVPLDYCRRDENWLTQLKLLGSWSLPYGIQVAGTLQNSPGPERAAVVLFNETSLGRVGTLYPGGVQLNVIEPGSFYGERFNQVDLRFAKMTTLGDGARLRAMFDIYNVLNANAVTSEQVSLAAAGDPGWLAPQAIMPGRLAKFAFQIDF